MPWSPHAEPVWVPWYETETTKAQPGQVGKLSNRAEAHVLRFALVYALLDASPDIKVPHLDDATALWEYAMASVVHRTETRRKARLSPSGVGSVCAPTAANKPTQSLPRRPITSTIETGY
jgi:hypothetical protein